MRVLLLGNNRVAVSVARTIRDNGDCIVGLVLHPESERRFGAELTEAAGPTQIIEAGDLRSPEGQARIRALGAEMGVSAYFGYLLRPDFLQTMPRGCINLHSSLLPFNRGAHPNVWTILDRTPAGATLHMVDAGVDTGGIIAQREVEIEPIDTGETLYRRLEEACMRLFAETWPVVRDQPIHIVPQEASLATAHKKADLARIQEVHLDQAYSGRDLINLLRAQTFPPHRGAYFVEKGRKVYMRLALEYDDCKAES